MFVDIGTISRVEAKLKSSRRFRRTTDTKKNCATCVRCESCITIDPITKKKIKTYKCYAITDEEMAKKKTIETNGIKFPVLKNNVCRCHKSKKTKK